MKILAGNLKGENINFQCKCCNAVFDLETKEDFYISNWVFKPIDRYGKCDFTIKIPEYSIRCPVCGYIGYVGYDPMDLGEEFKNYFFQSACTNIIFTRMDWKTRYKTNIQVKRK
jgi:hypothetical protein